MFSPPPRQTARVDCEIKNNFVVQTDAADDDDHDDCGGNHQKVRREMIRVYGKFVEFSKLADCLISSSSSSSLLPASFNRKRAVILSFHVCLLLLVYNFGDRGKKAILKLKPTPREIS